MDFRNGLPQWTSAMDFRNGLPQWTSAMDFRNGLPQWTSKSSEHNRLSPFTVIIASHELGEGTFIERTTFVTFQTPVAARNQDSHLLKSGGRY